MLYKVIVSQTFISTSFQNYIFISVSLQLRVLVLLMSQGTARAQVFLFSGTKFHPHIKMASYCITQLHITERTRTMVVFRKQ